LIALKREEAEESTNLPGKVSISKKKIDHGRKENLKKG